MLTEWQRNELRTILYDKGVDRCILACYDLDQKFYDRVAEVIKPLRTHGTKRDEMREYKAIEKLLNSEVRVMNSENFPSNSNKPTPQSYHEENKSKASGCLNFTFQKESGGIAIVGIIALIVLVLIVISGLIVVIYLYKPNETLPNTSTSVVSLPSINIVLTPTIISSNTPTPISLQTATPIKSCAFLIDPLFKSIYEEYKDYLGCPINTYHTIPTIGEQHFQGGHLFWRRDTDEVYVVYDRDKINDAELFTGFWFQPMWKWDGSYAEGINLTPPSDKLREPIRGFGWLWRTHLDGPEGKLGWAIDGELGFDNVAKVQNFEHGFLFRASDPKIYCLLDSGEFFSKR